LRSDFAQASWSSGRFQLARATGLAAATSRILNLVSKTIVMCFVKVENIAPRLYINIEGSQISGNRGVGDSATVLTVGTHAPHRHTRESGYPERPIPRL
jgi:hypothetical protein